MSELDLIDLLPKVLALLFTGATAGLLAGLLGVGGGIVIVPVLFYLFGILELAPQSAMHVAVGTSLATIVPTSIARSEEHTSELQSLMRISYAVFCLKKKTKINNNTH